MCAMAGMSASKTGPRDRGGPLQRQSTDQEPGHGEHNDQATRNRPPRFMSGARVSHSATVALGYPFRLVRNG
jgi:hypothetical protein